MIMEQAQEKSLEQQIAEAEERGYRRGLNEQIESKMREPAMWEGPEDALAAARAPQEEFQILAGRRKSVWED